MRPTAASRVFDLYLARAPHHFGERTVAGAFARLCPAAPVMSRYGVRLYPRPDKTTLYALLGTYGEAVAEQVRALRPGMAFIDIGANIGLFSLMAARAVGPAGRVFAFEPSPREFRALVRNIAANDLTDAVTAFDTAVAECAGPVPFVSGPAHHSGIGAVAVGDATLMVPAAGPAELLRLAESVAGRPAVIKIDVEGYELRVLRALTPFIRAAPVEKVIVEIDAAHLATYGDTPAALHEHMQRLGFGATVLSTRAHYDEVFVRRAS